MAKRERRHTGFSLDSLVIVEMDIFINHVLSFREISWFVAVNALCFQD